jgi:hypothetical protein
MLGFVRRKRRRGPGDQHCIRGPATLPGTANNTQAPGGPGLGRRPEPIAAPGGTARAGTHSSATAADSPGRQRQRRPSSLSAATHCAGDLEIPRTTTGRRVSDGYQDPDGSRSEPRPRAAQPALGHIAPRMQPIARADGGPRQPSSHPASSHYERAADQTQDSDSGLLRQRTRGVPATTLHTAPRTSLTARAADGPQRTSSLQRPPAATGS